MDAIALKDQLCSALREKSGLEPRRPYLGMSGIGRCPRKLYRDFLEGRDQPGDQQHWYCWTGYLHESGIIGLLGGVEKESVEVVAEFDRRFRGHTDHRMGPDLVEIKSVEWRKFCRVRESNQAEFDHLAQVQMYLRHGKMWPQALVVYVARDVPYREWEGPPFWVVEVRPDERLADRLDEKARRVLAAIDSGEVPVCECGWCRS